MDRPASRDGTDAHEPRDAQRGAVVQVREATKADLSGHGGLVFLVSQTAYGRSCPRGWVRRSRCVPSGPPRSEEHTSELQSLMRISYAVFCLKKTKNQPYNRNNHLT